EYVDDPEVINKLKKEYDVDFDKVQMMYTAEGERIYVVLADGQEVDEQVAESIQASMSKQPMDGGGAEEVEEEGVIVEEEEYQMDDEIVVRSNSEENTFQIGSDCAELQMEMLEGEVEEGQGEDNGEEVHDEMEKELEAPDGE
ncbi:hypothetical protein PMAYCL1PPCAC_32341, partial [Pristionchus mayeri]